MSKSAHHNARRAGVVVAGVTAAAALATGQRRQPADQAHRSRASPGEAFPSQAAEASAVALRLAPVRGRLRRDCSEAAGGGSLCRKLSEVRHWRL